MHNSLYDYSPITERPRFEWPGGKKVAFYAGVAVEHYAVDKPSTSIFAGTAGLTPDPLNYGWRDYGMRVGIWRMIESLDRHGMRATAFVNSDACSLYPQVIAAGNERNWSWVAHGRDNSTFQNGMEKSEERKYLTEVVDEIERHTGTRPTGWIGPALTETFETPQILADLGLEYVLDWCADDQPFYLNGEKPMLSVPYSTVLNDVMLFGGTGLSGEGFVQLIKDQYEQLSKEADDHVRVMGIGLHPFIINQPFRQKYLDLALDFIAEQDDVWITTSDDIAAHFKNNVADRPAA